MSPDLLEGALIAVGAFLAGQWLPRPHRRRRVRPPRPVEPICGCEHHNSFHDLKTGECHGTDGRPKYNDRGTYVGVHEIPCTCRQYSGPQPIPEFYAPEITP